MQGDIIKTNKVFVVLRNKKSREFRRAFSSLSAALGYIETGQKAGIHGAKEEFTEIHDIRDS